MRVKEVPEAVTKTVPWGSGIHGGGEGGSGGDDGGVGGDAGGDGGDSGGLELTVSSREVLPLEKRVEAAVDADACCPRASIVRERVF